MNGASYVVRALAAEGVDHVFMVPGGMNDPFMPAMTETEGLRAVVAAHEAGAAYMADGYARASGRLGVAFGIGGPGIFNMVTALAAARADRSAVLAISGEVPTDREGRGGFQDASGVALDDVSVLRPLTAQSVGVSVTRRCSTRSFGQPPLRRCANARRFTSRCRSTCSGPELDTPWVPLPEAAYRPMFLDFVALRAALAVFDGSAREPAANIVVLAGIGVAHAGGAAALAAAAERFAIPVATTLGAKGILPEDHPLSLGVFGYGGSRWATEAVLDPAVEVLVVLGSALSQRDTLHWNRNMLPSRELIHVDADPSLIGRPWPASVPVTGSPRLPRASTSDTRPRWRRGTKPLPSGRTTTDGPDSPPHRALESREPR